MSAFAVALSVFLAAGCSKPSVQEEDTFTASLLIQEKDLLPGDSGQGRHSALGIVHQDFAFSDVKSIKVSVTDLSTTPGTKFLVNFDLQPVSVPSPGWAATIPSLPKNKSLLFEAVAYSTTVALDANKLFTGSTQQTFSGDSPPTSLTIVLKPQSLGPILLPRILRISGPQTFTTGQPDNVSFLLEADTGTVLNYTVTPDASVASPGTGTFYPASGTFTLSGTSGTVVSQYQPPSVSSSTVFTHSVTVSNKQSGHSVTTTFKTTVIPPGRADTVNNTEVKVSFAPVINALSASRAEGSSDVVFTASVVDDSEESLLKYDWAFTPGGTYSPALTTEGSTRVGILHNYNQNVQGTLTLTVTDPDKNATVLNYVINKSQFLDTTSAPRQPTDLNSLRAGASHTCALFNSGAVRCWGTGSNGQLGYGSTLNYGDSATLQPGNIPSLGKVRQLALGANHTCALLDTGYVTCWGRNKYGQLGYSLSEDIGDNEAVSTFGFVNVGGLSTKIAAGQNHTCALLDTGSVRCWGLNSSGQLGYTQHAKNIGDDEQPGTRPEVQLGAPATDIVAGAYHTCALLNTGAVRCWGNNAFRQLGYGHTNPMGDTQVPTDLGTVPLTGTVLQLAAGAWHTCALMTTGTLRCWGLNSSGQLGYNNTTDPSPTGGDVPTGLRVLQVVAGSDHTCVLLESGGIKCWGYGEFGQLGYADTTSLSAPKATPIPLPGTAIAYQLTAGAYHTCALLSTGVATCWGLNSGGQLGYGYTSNALSAGGTVRGLSP